MVVKDRWGQKIERPLKAKHHVKQFDLDFF